MRETFVHMISVHAPQLFGLFCISGCWKNHADPNFRKHVAAGLKRSQRKRMVECLGGLYGFRQHMSHQPGEHEPAFVAALWWGTHTPTTWKKTYLPMLSQCSIPSTQGKKPKPPRCFFQMLLLTDFGRTVWSNVARKTTKPQTFEAWWEVKVILCSLYRRRFASLDYLRSTAFNRICGDGVISCVIRESRVCYHFQPCPWRAFATLSSMPKSNEKKSFRKGM